MKLVKSIVETDVNKLHRVSDKVDLNNDNLVDRLESTLMYTFQKLKGKAQGISAIQCGMPYSAILLRYEKGMPPIVVYNPYVIKSIGSRKSNEGCLSEGDKRYIVKRPLLIKVGYYERNKGDVVKWLPYKKARIFMHEYDHTKGILLQDK